jgi:hypothetical protein
MGSGGGRANFLFDGQGMPSKIIPFRADQPFGASGLSRGSFQSYKPSRTPGAAMMANRRECVGASLHRNIHIKFA